MASPHEEIANMLPVSDLDPMSWAVKQQQKRSHEDCYQVKQIGPFRYFAVFDGHGGTKSIGPQHVAHFAVQNLHILLAQALLNTDLNDSSAVTATIKNTFINCDRTMHKLNLFYGSTCTAILIDDVLKLIYQINLGDSRSLIFQNHTLISVTVDNDPDADIERNRIVNAGGSVYGGRIGGMLRVARSFGDFPFKVNNDTDYDPINGEVSAVPDIRITYAIRPLNILLTSDAPFEGNYSNQQLINLYHSKMRQFSNLQLCADTMVNEISNSTSDDISIILVEV